MRAFTAFLILGVSTCALADIVTFEFNGHVQQIMMPLPDPWGDVQVGDEITVVYEFDSESRDLEVDPYVGIYEQPHPFTVSVRGAQETIDSFEIGVYDYTKFGLDLYLAYTIGGAVEYSVTLADTFEMDALPSDDLPVFENLDKFDAKEIHFVVNGFDSMRALINGFSVELVCAADCNADGSLSILDFVCYQQLFVEGDPAADCNGDGSLDILDFVCYQQSFVDGCP